MLTLSIVVDDYLSILTPLVEQCPDILFLSQAFPTAFNILVGALTLLNTDTTFRALGIIRAILGHDSLSPAQGLQVPPKFPLYAKAIAEVIEKDGPLLVHNLFAGLMEHFAPEMMSGVITTVRILTQLWTASMQQWVQTVLEQMSVPPALEQARTQFILDFNAYAFLSRYSPCFQYLTYFCSALAAGDLDQIKPAISHLQRNVLRTKDRRRPLDR